MKNKKYPRYFTNIKEKIDWGKIAYIFLDGEDLTTETVPYKYNRIGYTEKDCENNVKNGYWREISIEEAVLL